VGRHMALERPADKLVMVAKESKHYSAAVEDLPRQDLRCPDVGALIRDLHRCTQCSQEPRFFNFVARFASEKVYVCTIGAVLTRFRKNKTLLSNKVNRDGARAH